MQSKHTIDICNIWGEDTLLTRSSRACVNSTGSQCDGRRRVLRNHVVLGLCAEQGLLQATISAYIALAVALDNDDGMIQVVRRAART
jgi:hypothetical protein